MKGGLPEGWECIPVSQICSKLRGVSYKKGEESRQPGDRLVPVIRANNIAKDHLVLEELVYVPSSRVSSNQFIRKNDVVVAMSSGSKSVVGKTAQAPADWQGAFGAFCGVLRPDSRIDGRYFGYFFRTQAYRSRISDLSAGTNINNLKNEHFDAINIPIAPLSEQRRIVAKLEQLLGKVETCQERLTQIPLILKRFRQAVLAAACSGRLTEDWRSSDAVEDDMPVGWRWMSIEQLIPPGGIFDGPFGSNLKTSDYTSLGVRVIRLENVGKLHFNIEKETYISYEKYNSLKKHTVGEGDIIFASFISEEIRACLLPKIETPAIAKADCFCLRPKTDLINQKYLLLQVVSQESYNYLCQEVHGATRPRINTTQLRKMKVRVCSTAEQNEIVRRVEELFALADQIESRYSKAQTQVEKITPSLLAKAFRGELVPTEAEMERSAAKDNVLESIGKR